MLSWNLLVFVIWDTFYLALLTLPDTVQPLVTGCLCGWLWMYDAIAAARATVFLSVTGPPAAPASVAFGAIFASTFSLLFSRHRPCRAGLCTVEYVPVAYELSVQVSSYELLILHHDLVEWDHSLDASITNHQARGSSCDCLVPVPAPSQNLQQAIVEWRNGWHRCRHQP